MPFSFRLRPRGVALHEKCISKLLKYHSEPHWIGLFLEEKYLCICCVLENLSW
ncbi:hypothetical protein KFK09_011408 [Dendrobium nobile]|uniref:Uncharacterized protein n=1 Tax=Dendrobium nobile TaxID=94219 RepID=A0A8T3BCJ5_DENNO|nr:hypothetical protein KFK09_011408 [Dendrobium nobile]